MDVRDQPRRSRPLFRRSYARLYSGRRRHHDDDYAASCAAMTAAGPVKAANDVEPPRGP
ncbi:MAG TPA: hypothetical protein VMW56_21825 [Candidatus Margulisiibacteriota bacterium]|nr:hypothetical protein [Candidatus Margulisiibacteriota bacterium]